MADVRIEYDPAVDAANIYFVEELAPGIVKRKYPCDPVGVHGMINLAFDAEWHLLYLEIIGASKRLPPALLEAAERLT